MNFRMVWMGPDDDSESAPQRQGELIPRRSFEAIPPYAQRGAEIVRQEMSQNGRLKITVLTNFQARIARDLVLDDGKQAQREFGIEAVLGETSLAFSLSSAEFSRMGWVLSKLGPQAIIYPGQHQHARAAIPWLSGKVLQERTFTHMGWRKYGAKWVYLHAGGALGVDGHVAGVRVQLPAALMAYQIGKPKTSADRSEVIRDSLRFLRLAPDRISFPLLAGVYRAALGGVDFSLFLVGQSGVFKTALATLCQQHFGAGMNAARLPANFASTGNALESLAFHAKDALLVTDDFAPTGMQSDRGLQNIAERLFRAAGNRQGRSRIGGGGKLRASQPPGV